MNSRQESPLGVPVGTSFSVSLDCITDQFYRKSEPKVVTSWLHCISDHVWNSS